MNTRRFDPAMQRVHDALEAAGSEIQYLAKGGFRAQCPSHDDRTPSLYVDPGSMDCAVMTCRATCSNEEVMQALGFPGTTALFDKWNGERGHVAVAAPPRRDVSKPARSNGNGKPSRNAPAEFVEDYIYTDETGTPRHKVRRLSNKQFPQYRADGRGGWIKGMDWEEGGTEHRTPRFLYHLPALIAAERTKVVRVPEGEKDVHAIEQAGGLATCNPGGVGGGWLPEFNEYLRGRHVEVVADKDEPGRNHARQVADSLEGIAASVRIVEAAEGKDASDHLSAGKGLEELVQVWPAPEPEPAAEAPQEAPESAVEDAEPELTVDEPTAAAAPTEAKAKSQLTGEAVDIAVQLDWIVGFITKYVKLPTAASADALALFVVHTYAIGAAYYTPYVYIKSPERRCGKSRLLSVLERVVHSPVKTASLTEAVLYRLIEERQPTMIFDEVDRLFSAASQKNDNTDALTKILNAGNERDGAKAHRMGGKSFTEICEFNVFSPKVLAGIDNDKMPDTILDRSIQVVLQRRPKGDRITAPRWRSRLAAVEAEPTREKLQAWADAHTDELVAVTEALEDDGSLDDRMFEAWEPLFAIAELAGGDWPARAQAASAELSPDAESEGEGSRGAKLLADIRSVFESVGQDWIWSGPLCDRLNEIEGSPWAGWNRRRTPDKPGIAPDDVAYLLRPYRTPEGAHIASVQIKREGSNKHGYKLGQFKDAFSLYAPISRYPATSQAGSGIEGTTDPLPAATEVAPEKAPDSALQAEGSGVAANSGGAGHLPRTAVFDDPLDSPGILGSDR